MSDAAPLTKEKKFRCDECKRKFPERSLYRLGDRQLCFHDYEWGRLYAAAAYLRSKRV